MLRILAAIAIASLPASPVYAAACRDSHGKFIKCPDKAAAAPKKCKNAKGQFAKCGTAGAKPV